MCHPLSIAIHFLLSHRRCHLIRFPDPLSPIIYCSASAHQLEHPHQRQPPRCETDLAGLSAPTFCPISAEFKKDAVPLDSTKEDGQLEIVTFVKEGDAMFGRGPKLQGYICKFSSKINTSHHKLPRPT